MYAFLLLDGSPHRSTLTVPVLRTERPYTSQPLRWVNERTPWDKQDCSELLVCHTQEKPTRTH
jgi:hypothetical protein